MDPEAYKKYNKPEAGAELGVYKHPDSDEEVHLNSFPAADAFVRQGFRKVRDLPTAAERRQIKKEDDERQAAALAQIEADKATAAQAVANTAAKNAQPTAKSKKVAKESPVTTENAQVNPEDAKKGNE